MFVSVCIDDITAGLSAVEPLTVYAGPVTYLQWQFIWDSPDCVDISANAPDVFLHGGPGDDALAAIGGSNVLDGGEGSNFLVGSTGVDGGDDAFFADLRNGGVIWNTLVNFHPGDSITLWGWNPRSQFIFEEDNGGAPGATGATFHFSVAGDGIIDASITFAGYTLAEATHFRETIGTTADGMTFLEITADPAPTTLAAAHGTIILQPGKSDTIRAVTPDETVQLTQNDVLTLTNPQEFLGTISGFGEPENIVVSSNTDTNNKIDLPTISNYGHANFVNNELLIFNTYNQPEAALRITGVDQVYIVGHQNLLQGVSTGIQIRTSVTPDCDGTFIPDQHT
jgi:hypothetical protein